MWILDDIQERVNELSRGSKVAMVVINFLIAIALTVFIVGNVLVFAHQITKP